MIETINFSEKDLNRVRESLTSQSFNSDFKFLQSHKGMRKAELSILVGSYGNGKSTLLRTMIFEFLKNRKKVYGFLSEEKTKLYAYPIYNVFYYLEQDRNMANSFLSNLMLESQFDLRQDLKNIEKFMQYLELLIVQNELDVIVFDNFTTSFMGRGNINDQAIAIELMKELAVKYDVVFLLVVHTVKGTNIYNQIVTGEDVRGNATTTNIGSYNYVLTTYFRLDIPRSFVVVDKARYHSQANKKVFELVFDDNTHLFKSDMPSSFDAIEEIQLEVRTRIKTKKVEI